MKTDAAAFQHVGNLSLDDRSRASFLRGWRILYQYTQEQIAELLEVDRKTVNRWERGHTSVPASVPLALLEIGRQLRGE